MNREGSMPRALHRYLDGELRREELPEELREEARAWDRMVEDFRQTPVSPVPSDLAARVRAGIERAGAPEARSAAEVGARTGVRPGAPAAGAAAGSKADDAAGVAWRAAWEWLRRPRTVRVSPLAGLVGAALLAVLVIRPWEAASPTGIRTPPAEPTPELASDAPAESARLGREDTGTSRVPERISVQFVLRAPEATAVAVAGDFSGWEPAAQLHDPDGDGVWTGRVTLRPGIHEYMFVVDGNRWVTDPRAEHYMEDGFGGRNAVIALSVDGPPAGRGP